VRIPISKLMVAFGVGRYCTPMIAFTTGNTGGRSYLTGVPPCVGVAVPPSMPGGTQPGSTFEFVAPLHATSMRLSERELDGEPAEARVGATATEDVVGFVARGDVLPTLDVDALGRLDVLELEAELQLDVAAAAREIDTNAEVTGAAGRVLHEQLELRLRDPNVAETEANTVFDLVLWCGGSRRRVGCRSGSCGRAVVECRLGIGGSR
jgi:hypothetical protein